MTAVNLRSSSSSSKVNVEKLFQQIHQHCHIPFKRLDPLNEYEDAFVNKESESTKIQLATKSNEFKGNQKFPKTKKDVEHLFADIKSFCGARFSILEQKLELDNFVSSSQVESNHVTSTLLQKPPSCTESETVVAFNQTSDSSQSSPPSDTNANACLEPLDENVNFALHDKSNELPPTLCTKASKPTAIITEADILNTLKRKPLRPIRKIDVNCLPKGNAEVESLFHEINNYLGHRLPFMITDLNEVDKPILRRPKIATNGTSNDSNIALPSITAQQPVVKRSQRIAKKITQQLPIVENHSANQSSTVRKYSFVSLFNSSLSRSSDKTSNLNKHLSSSSHAKRLPKGQTQTQVTGKEKQKRSKRKSATIKNNIHQSVEPSGPPAPTLNTNLQLFSPIGLSTFDIAKSINSCKNYLKNHSVESAATTATTSTTANKQKAKDQLKKQNRVKRKRNDATVGELLTRDDSLESGYSSSQSSVPSPASTSTFASSSSSSNMTTNISSTVGSSSVSSSSICSTSYMTSGGRRGPSSSASSSNGHYAPSVNPNGEVIYLRSQYEYYIDKINNGNNRHRKNATSSSHCDNASLSSCSSIKFDLDLANDIYNVPSNAPHSLATPIDRHQRVVEWQCKTLQASSFCPPTPPQMLQCYQTPPHDQESEPSFDDKKGENMEMLDLSILDMLDFGDVNNTFGISSTEGVDDLETWLQTACA